MAFNLADREFDNMGCRCCVEWQVPTATEIEQRSLFLRPGDRDPELLLLPDHPQRDS
ncbi:hypothetical protein D3C86_1627730 [compost metagenome]